LCPIELLDELQGIENRMGRVKVIDKGPRNIDLDIVLYDNETFLNDRLQIPHKLMLEREFVLRPLCEYASLAVLSSSTN
jgi:2-amino-4-hydroxy-6-hydroxymethyldihydropteridine diphosphokinase/dihydropteroate synthase